MVYGRDESKQNAICFLRSIDQGQRDKIRRMLDNGISCCHGVAMYYGDDPLGFEAELKEILAGGQ